MDKPENTEFLDNLGNSIYVGDILFSDDEYLVMVCKCPNENNFYGSLICEIEDSCRNIPYALNRGKGYQKIYGFDFPGF